MSKDVVILESVVRVNLANKAVKLVTLPKLEQPVSMGIYGKIAEHYGIAKELYAEHPSTLDYVVGATVACLAGTLSRELIGYKIPVMEDRLVVYGEGKIGTDEGVLVIREILVSDT